MKRSLGLLLAGGLAFWLVVAYPAKWLWGDSAVVFSAVAGLLCLVPAAATLVWSLRVLPGALEQHEMRWPAGIKFGRRVPNGGHARFFALPVGHP